jgi:putative acetyltransferase
MTTCQIIEYEDRYHSVFRDLNLEWLVKYNLLEPRDSETLDKPREMIVETGGVIYLAKLNEAIVGSAALIKEHDGVYELAKMSVAAEYRKNGISRLLLERCIDKARELGATKIELFSNHQLKAALGLYEKYGFQYVPVEDSPFETADIKMELLLKNVGP